VRKREREGERERETHRERKTDREKRAEEIHTHAFSLREKEGVRD